MGLCVVCGKKTGILRGRTEYNGNEYCDLCYSPFINKCRRDKYEESKIKNNVPKECLSVNYKYGYAKMPNMELLVWLDGNNMCFFPADVRQNENYSTYQISLDQIEYYATRGEVWNETKISGGGGTVGGSSIAGAIVGGVVAGGAGAIIGSRKNGKIEPIKSQIVKHDERETFLNYYVDNVKHSLYFSYNDYKIFINLIPNKEFGKHQVQYSVKPVINNSKSNVSNNNLEVIKQIKELSVIKDEGIITEEEFNEKKRLLLEKIK